MISFICDVQKNIKCLGGGSQTSTSTTSPNPAQQPYLSDVFSNAQNLYGTYTPNYYPDSTVAPMNSGETGAISNIENLGSNGTSSLNAANGALTNYANGSMLSANNPAFQNVANQTAASVTPELMASFTQGTTDNPNVALAASNGVANAVGNLAYNNYNQQSQNQITAANDASNLYNTALGGAQAGLSAGQAQQTQDQNSLSDAVNRYNYYQSLPYTRLNNYADLVNGNYGSTTTQSQPSQSLLGSIFSDRRLKENIVRVGRADNTLPIYKWNYKGDPKTYLGFMADEVQKVKPDAVHMDASGFLKVDYNKATEAK